MSPTDLRLLESVLRQKFSVITMVYLSPDDGELRVEFDRPFREFDEDPCPTIRATIRRVFPQANPTFWAPL